MFVGCSGLTNATLSNAMTSIIDGTFSDCSSLTSITIPNSVTSIGSHAFWNCTGLTSLKVNNTIPPTLGSGTFYSVPTSTCNLVVPVGATNTYKTTSGWNAFSIITESSNITAVKSAISEAFEVYPNPSTGELLIKIGNNLVYNPTLCVYNLTGKKIYNTSFIGDNVQLNLSALALKGYYLIQLQDNNGVAIGEKKVLFE